MLFSPPTWISGPPSAKLCPSWLKPLVTPLHAAHMWPPRTFCAVRDAFPGMGIWHSNLTKMPLIYSVWCFNAGGLGVLFFGDKPTKAPHSDGTVWNLVLLHDFFAWSTFLTGSIKGIFFSYFLPRRVICVKHTKASGVAWLNVGGGPHTVLWFWASNSILFKTAPIKARHDKMC